jgi:hypothetical protein
VVLRASVRHAGATSADDTEAVTKKNRTTAGGSNYAAPSLEYLFDSRTVTYSWPCHIGVDFSSDC